MKSEFFITTFILCMFASDVSAIISKCVFESLIRNMNAIRFYSKVDMTMIYFQVENVKASKTFLGLLRNL